MSVSIKHDMHFETVVDENNPTAKRLLKLPPESQRMFLGKMLEDLLAPAITPILEKLNENNSWAELKVIGNVNA
jgi:hypothetical protein